jgi:hypothetical protein
VKVWFDGRNDYWGRDRTLSYMSLMNGQPDKVGQEALRQATCALLPLFGTFQGAEVEKLIQNDPSWKQIPTSDPYHLYIKTSLISPNAA